LIKATLKIVTFMSLLFAGICLAGLPGGDSGVLKEQRWFWTHVFGKFGSDTYLIHDRNHPQVVVDVVQKKHGVKAEAKKYFKRYQAAVKRFASSGASAEQFGPMEKRVAEVYRRDVSAWNDLIAGKVKLRLQRGMYDDFKIALKRAAPYLEYKEYIFRQEGVPKEVARLPFIESMFSESAESHVGAVGMWQFMPYTGKQFMRISRYIDERRSPLKAALAAARYLKGNYKKLGTWPLAITAYNHGPAGMARAKKTHGSSKGKYFGFASKNCYGELLAVQDVFAQNQDLYRSYSSAFGKKLDAIALSQSMTISQVVKASGLDKKDFRKYNPDFLTPAFGKYRSRKLPQGFVVVLPREKIVAFKNNAKDILVKIAANKQKKGRG